MNSMEIIIKCKETYAKGNYNELICKQQLVYPPIPRHINQILTSQFVVALLDEYLHATNFDKIDKKTKFPVSMLYAIVTNLLKSNKYQLAIKVVQNHFDKPNAENHHIINYNVAKFYSHLKQYKKAVFVLENVLKQKPFFRQAVYEIAYIYINHLNRHEEAMTILQRHIKAPHAQNQHLYALFIYSCHSAPFKNICPLSQLNQSALNLFNYYNVGLYFRLRNDQRAKQIFIEIIQILQEKIKENSFIKRVKDVKLLILSKINLLLIISNQTSINKDLKRVTMKSNAQKTLIMTKYHTIGVKQLSEQIVEQYGSDLPQTTLIRLKKYIKQKQYARKQQKITVEPCKGMPQKTFQDERYSGFNQQYMNLRDINNRKLKYLLKKQKQLNVFFNNLSIKKGKDHQYFKFVVKISNQARARLIKNAKNDLNRQDSLSHQQEWPTLEQINNQSLKQIIQSIIDQLPSNKIKLKLNNLSQIQTVHKSQTKRPPFAATKESNNFSKIEKVLQQPYSNISKVKASYKLNNDFRGNKKVATQAGEQMSNKKDSYKQLRSKKQNMGSKIAVFDSSTSQKSNQKKKAQIQKYLEKTNTIVPSKGSQKGILKTQRSQNLFRIKVHQSIKSIQAIPSKKYIKKSSQSIKNQQTQSFTVKEIQNHEQICKNNEQNSQMGAKVKDQEDQQRQINKNESQDCNIFKKTTIIGSDQLACQQQPNYNIQIIKSSKTNDKQSSPNIKLTSIILQQNTPFDLNQNEMKSSHSTLLNAPEEPALIIWPQPNEVTEQKQEQFIANEERQTYLGNTLDKQLIRLECQSKLSIVIISSQNIKQYSQNSQSIQHRVHQVQNKQRKQQHQLKTYSVNKPDIYNVESLKQFQKSLKIIEQKVMSSYKKEQEKITSKRIVEQEIHQQQKDYDPMNSTFQLTNFDKNAFGFLLKNNAKSNVESQTRHQFTKPLVGFKMNPTNSQKKAEQQSSKKVVQDKQTNYGQIKKQLQKCNKLMEEEKFEQAFQLYNFLYKNYKKDWEKQQILLGIGNLFICQEKYEEAQKTFNKCIKFNNAEAFLKLGLLQIKNSHIQLGVENIQKANCIKRNDRQIENKLVYGYSLRQETMEKALTLAQNILEKYPESLETLVMIAKILENQGKVKEAIEIVHAIDSFQPTEYIKHYLGVLYLIDSKLAQAFKNFKAALQIKPDYIPSLIEIATIISEVSPKQSVAILTQVLEYDPGNRKALARLGKIYEVNQNDFENAMLTYRTALEYQPNYESYMKVGDCLAKKQSYIQALINYKEALNLKKTHQVYYKIGLMLSIKNQTQKAIDNFELAIQLSQKQGSVGSHPNIRQYLRYLGKLLIKISSFDQAINAFEKILEHQESKQTYKLIGDAHYGKKQYEVALQSYSKANSLSPSEDIQILENMAICFDKLQEYLASKEIYEKILQKHPDNLKCLNNLANVQLIIGQTNEAFYNFENLLYHLPKNMEKRLMIADIYAEVGDWSKVQYHLVQCYKLKQNDQRVLQRLVNLYKQKRDYKLMNKYQKKRSLIKLNTKII